jgi:AraC-like DNA-binding protein
MMPSPMEGLIQVPFGLFRESRASSRYHWDNSHRGTDPFVILQYTHTGEGVFELHDESHRVPTGKAFIALVPEPSRYYCPDAPKRPWIFSWINFYGDWALHVWRTLRQQTGPVIALPPAAMRPFLRLVRGRRNHADPYERSRLAYELYVEILRHAPPLLATQPFQNVISYFHAHYQEGVRMKEAAARAGMSREHFSRLFAAQMGCGPATYLRNIRLDAAARLLRTTEVPVGEVAFRSGWTSATKLDLFFKRRFGLSPRHYRQRRERVALEGRPPGRPGRATRPSE